eukprot:gene2846-5598_t
MLSITVSIIFILVGLIPIILDWNFDTSNVTRLPDGSFDVPLQKGVVSIQHQFAMAACLASFFPLVTELITDSILLSRSQKSTYGFQWLLVVGLYVAFIGYWINQEVFGASSWAVYSGDFLAANGSSMQHEWVSTLTELSREVDIAVDILDNLLLYDRLSGNTLTLNTKKLNAKTLIKESLQPFYRQAKEKNMVLNLEFLNDNDNGNITVDSPIFIIGDQNKLVQVFWNLLSNALKYTSVGGTVNIRISSVYSGNYFDDVPAIEEKNKFPLLYSLKKVRSWRNARIRGEDGIILSNSEESSREVQLQQTPNTLRIEVQDTVSHQIMTLHGGNLSVHSEGIGCGSIFTMEIPLCSENNVCIDIDDAGCTPPNRTDRNMPLKMFSNKEIGDMNVMGSSYVTTINDVVETNMRSRSILVSHNSTHDDNNNNENENEKQMETDEENTMTKTTFTKLKSTSINAMCEHNLAQL